MKTKKILVYVAFIAFYIINAFVLVILVEKKMPLENTLSLLNTPMWAFYTGAFLFFIFTLLIAKIVADRIR